MFCAACCLELGQVVAQRSPHHVVDRMRSHADGTGKAVAAGPAGSIEVGVLSADLKSPLFSLIELVPEANRAFTDVARVTCAGSAPTRSTRAGGESLCGAAGVVGKGRAVTADAIGRDGCGGDAWVGRLSSSAWARSLTNAAATRNCGSGGHSYGLVSNIGCAAGIFAADITVEVKLGVGMEFERTEP